MSRSNPRDLDRPLRRAVIYTRVSSVEQVDNMSLATQEASCRAYCEREGWEVVKLFEERGESAKSTDRTQLQRMLRFCHNKRNRVDVVVVYKVNRFSRQSGDHHAVRSMLAAFGVTLRSATEPITDDSTGRLMEGMLAVFAQFDNDQRSERTKAGMRAAAEAGRWSHKPPIGYLKARDKSGPSLVLDPERAGLVRDAFERYATGAYSQKGVLAYVTALGLRTKKGKPLSPARFRDLLRNPIYTGRVSLPKRGIDVPGDFAAIVSEETFEQVQGVMADKANKKREHLREHPDFPLRGILHCATCGKPITASNAKGRNGTRYAYYHCRTRRQKCPGINVRAETVHDLFAAHLTRLTPKPSYLRLFREAVLDVWRERQSEAIAARSALEKRRDKIALRKARLTNAYLDQAMSREDFEQHGELLAQELQIVRVELSRMDAREVDIEAVIDFGVYALGHAGRMWEGFNADQRRRFATLTFPSGLPFDGEAFGTAETTCLFNRIEPATRAGSGLASPTGFEPVLPA